MPDISNVCRNILLLICGAIVVALAIFGLVTPVIIPLSPQVTQETRSNFIVFTPILAVLLLSSTYFYLRPVHQLERLLNQEQPPPPDLAQRARTRAFSAPFYLFFMPVGLVALISFLADLYGLLARPDYAFALQFSYSLLLIVTSAAMALTISSLSRRILRPVLIATADLAQDVGRRYEMRLRLAIVVLSLNLVVFFFLGVLAFNLVFQAALAGTADRFRQWEHDVAQAAPYLDDEALRALIDGSDILQEHQAAAFLSASDGHYLIPPPASYRPPTTPALDELIEQDDYFVLLLPVEWDGGSGQLGITYTFAPEETPIVRNTLLILLAFGAIILGLSLVTARYLADDITRDLKYVTNRLLDIARRGHVGAKVHTLSLDEVGDLIAAFDKVRETVTQQQDELNQRVEHMHQLHQASLALASSVDFQQTLDRICQVAQDITASHTVTLYLYNPDDNLFVRASQLGYDVSPDAAAYIRPQGMTYSVLHSRQPVLVQNTLDHPSVSPRVVHRGVRSLIAVPVISRAQVMGVLYVNSREVNAYDDEDVQVVSALASQAAATIENARLLDETLATARVLERRARNLVMINRISTDLTSLLDPYEIFNVTAKHMVDLMDVDHCSVLIFEEGAGMGMVVAEYPQTGTVGQRLSRTDNPAIDRVLTTKKPLAVTDILEEPLMEPARETLAEMGVRALLIAPLVARDQVIGTIGLDVLHRPYEFSGEEQELCRTIAAQAAIATSNARLLYDLQQQSRALTRKSQELAAESSKLDAILTNMADGLVVTDLAGRIMLSNPAFKTIAGLPIGRSLRGRLLDETFSLLTLRAVIADAMDNPDQITAANLDLADGRVLKATASALRMRQGGAMFQESQLKGVVTVLRDITHEVEVDRLKTEFISAVSHELRTPLTSILGFANLIRSRFRRRIAPFVAGDAKARQTADRILENLAIIETESQRLTRLINDLLDIAQMESGRVEWHMGDVDVGQVIRDSVTAAAALAREKGLTVNLAVLAPLPSVWGDRDRLVQVMTNLLSNAIKFTDEGEIGVSSWVWTADASASPSPHSPPDLQPPALVVSVTDTGVGIATKDLPLIFERFRQLGDVLTEKPKGTGLGLPICKEIVEHHEGAIWVESEVGVGSTFSFALPLVEPVGRPPMLHEIRQRVAERLPAASAGEQEPLVLIVDDKASVRCLLRQELAGAGYRVIEAADGVQALAEARRQSPALIIMDVMVPGVSGFDVSGALQADERTADIPILILSIIEDQERGLRLGEVRS